MAFTFPEELSREFGGATMLSASNKDVEGTQWFIDRFHLVQIMILVEYLFLFIMCLVLVVYLRRNRHIALTGDSKAARKVLLPAFAPLLWLLAGCVGVYSVVMALFVTLKWFNGKFSNALLEVFYSMRLFVFGLVMVFLLQKSVSIPALRRSVAITLILALYTLPVEVLLMAYVEPSRPNLAFMIMSAVRALMLVFFAYVFVRPPARASKQIQSMMTSFPKMTVKGTVDYMAPEIINGKAGLAAYGEAADVYSLAMTMWDVLHPGSEKFPELKSNHLQIFASVVEGKRPQLELEIGNGKLHSGLCEIIEAAWQPRARSRPSAQEIVKALERVQEELLAVFATDLLPELSNDISSSVCKTRRGTADVFTGELIVARLQDMKFVHSPCEAVRLGNAFMDAGLLHHKKHDYSFENTGLQYFFDVDNIRLCQPLDNCKASVVISMSEESSPVDDDLERQKERFGSSSCTPFRESSTCSFSEDHSSVHNNPTGSKPSSLSEGLVRPSSNAGTSVSGDNGCRCRKLGQRLQGPRNARRQRLRRKFKAAIADEHALTKKLLEVDDSAVTPKELELGHSMDAFDFVAMNIQAA
ncbi:hypothetical protein PR002_g2642 [Phytophthora rubi]|uniref:Protein kinase domain-containing protein n=1 Tax=Phytophthora rubi TaxID=129364 RepID=A0A6A3NMH6_9STRA|nr:hypothetical protein PR002_g2642 [Phytophthora rubi]